MQATRGERRGEKRRQERSAWRSWAVTMAFVLVVALLCLRFVFVVASVDGHSMEPGLFSGEKLFVWRLQYVFDAPKRGEIVVCTYPATGNQYYVKRVIGLPGETLEIKDGRVLVDGSALAEAYVDEAPVYDIAQVTLSEGEIFVMGDNRNHSTDSRDARIGPIPRSRVVGKALALFWPLPRMHVLPAPYYETYIPYGTAP